MQAVSMWMDMTVFGNLSRYNCIYSLVHAQVGTLLAVGISCPQTGLLSAAGGRLGLVIQCPKNMAWKQGV